MTPSDWIGMASIAVTVLITQRIANAKLTDTIQGLFVKRLDTIEADNLLRDEWIGQVENMAVKTSGQVQVLESQMKTVERICERRHEPRAGFQPVRGLPQEG